MKLKTGDVRQEGDEIRICLGPHGGYFTPNRGVTGVERWSDWKHVTSLIGHPILQSDLMHLKFRRGE